MLFFAIAILLIGVTINIIAGFRLEKAKKETDASLSRAQQADAGKLRKIALTVVAIGFVFVMVTALAT